MPRAPSPAETSAAGGEIDDDTPLSARSRRLVEYWRTLRPGSKALPSRALFDPAAVVDLLPDVWLLETMDRAGRRPTAEGPRFRCRLYGSALAEAFGRDLTGALLDEADPAFETSEAGRDFRAVVARRLPRWWRGPVAMTTPRQTAGVEVVMLPLAVDGEHVDMILNYAQPLYGDPPRPLDR
ncbi:MAG: PAS domain-containing protein [Marivibrio sp.]|uniref:PAS domain-containing protein n=1 Tax=Marivibrio sp. TaxID=2039719 RepID=UPI0032EE2EA7